MQVKTMLYTDDLDGTSHIRQSISKTSR